MKIRSSLNLLSLPILLGFSSPAFALEVDEVLVNIARIIHPLTIMVMGISFVAGIAFIFRALAMLKRFGMSQQMAQPGEIGGPLVHLVVGTILVYLPTTTDVSLSTLFGEATRNPLDNKRVDFQVLGRATDNILGYIAPGIEDKWGTVANTLVLYIQFIGFLAFVRGWFIIAKAGNPGVQAGTISKGITHIVGGIIAVNFVGAVEIIRETIFGA